MCRSKGTNAMECTRRDADYNVTNEGGMRDGRERVIVMARFRKQLRTPEESRVTLCMIALPSNSGCTLEGALDQTPRRAFSRGIFQKICQ